MNRRELKAYQYRRMLEERRGHNYEYWGPKHDQMLESGWKILEMKGSGRQWSRVFKKEATSSEDFAKREVERLRAAGNFARIICGYDKNVQRIKMFTVIYKEKARK